MIKTAVSFSRFMDYSEKLFFPSKLRKYKEICCVEKKVAPFFCYRTHSSENMLGKQQLRF